jgi:uncharacterized protein involved in exopolysaccharide biosynthesis
MKSFLRIAARLYPGWWRQRYGREFDALLEDVDPGWRELIDVATGALKMQIRTLATIQVLCTLAGGIVGGAIAMRTPQLFASSATILFTAPDVASANSKTAQDFRGTLVSALVASGAMKARTLVEIQKSAREGTVKVTYLDRDPARSQQVAEKLAAAVVANSAERVSSSQILVAPQFPTAPIRPDYRLNVASGGGVGLAGGAIATLLLRLRRK